MAACEPQTYAGVTREQLECFAEAAKNSFGLALEGDEGSVSAMGTTLAWKYDPAAQQLTLVCEHKPIFLSCKDIYGQVGKMLERCRQ